MKIKKLLTILMAAAVITGTTATTAIDTYAVVNEDALTSTISVKGLSENVETELMLYQVVSIDEERNNWIIVDWAKPFIEEKDGKYEITNPEGLTRAAESQYPTRTIDSSRGASYVEFAAMPIGAYVIRAAADNTSYLPMIANTYDDTDTYIKVKDETVITKSETVKLTKEEIEGDQFVGKGETVKFEVTTTFPYFAPETEEKQFIITDKPTGLQITRIKDVTIGGTSIGECSFTYDEETGVYTLDLSNQIKENNENAGKEVVVTYEALVTSENGYSNTANSSGATADSTVVAHTGNIIFTKYASDETPDKLEDNVALKGAKFEIYKATEEGTPEGKALEFVGNNGIYTPALAEDENKVTELETIENGTVTINGLGEGKYYFKETVAPDGYSVNKDGVVVEITADTTKDVTETGHMLDTKLSSLPSTGGIGTTIFTIGGCAIMIAAAGLFFASRRKANK